MTRTAKSLRRVVGRLPRGGEAREGQVEMAEAVARALEEGRHLVAQAGTGTGKSLAYLVPAILSGKRVVVATATKALQDQLAQKDLPFLAETLGQSFEFAVLKGRSNYVCLQRAGEVMDAGEQQSLGAVFEPAPGAGAGAGARAPARGRGADSHAGRGDGESLSLAGEVARLVEWSRTTETGDRAELDFEPRPRAWSLVSVTAHECPGASRCPSGGRCLAERARYRAAAADVVVVNMHLYGAHLASGGAVLPEHDAVVFDEAHELEDVLAESLGLEIGAGRVRGLATAARTALGSAGTALGSAGGRRAARRRGAPDPPASPGVDDLFATADRLDAALVARMGERLPPGVGGELGDVLAILAGRIARVEADLREPIRAASGASAGQATGSLARVTRALLALERCRSDVESVATAGDDSVVWVEGGERAARLRLAPIDVSKVMADGVFTKMPTVMTTATVPKGLGARLGADPEQLDEIDVGSPFPYREHALLYCAAHLPERRRGGAEQSEEALDDELAALIDAAGGRTLALFTSWRAMHRAVEAMRPRLAYRVLAQDELPKALLVEQFTADASSCLFATMSFWQGVDVPGATLSLVVIDRIPFPRPDDPLVAARRDRAGPAAFRTIDLPRAATMLAQGAGRLIRSSSDRGVVAVLDPRLAKASYRWDLVNALPPMRRTRDRAEAEAFLRELREAPAGAPDDHVPVRAGEPAGGAAAPGAGERGRVSSRGAR